MSDPFEKDAKTHSVSVPSYLSLKGKILLWVMPIAILGLLSLSYVAYRYITIVIERELSNSMLMSVGKSAESINRWLATIMLEPETIASTPAAKRINEDFSGFDLQNINRHKILHRKYPDIFQDIYAANRNGEYHTVQQKDSTYSLFVGDISNRPYFISIMSGGPTQITPPLISRTTGIPTIFIVAPILDDRNQPQGLVGAGISLKYIQQIAKALKAGETGYGFIVADDGTYISHPDSELVMQKKITDHEAASEKALGQLMVSGDAGMYRYTQGIRRMVAFYQPIPITGWSVATVLPEAELFAPAIKMMKLLTTITLLFAILIGIAILLAMQRLTKPLQTLAVRTQEIATGNLEGVVDLKVTSKDEIGSLSRSFNIMTGNLKKSLSVLKKSEDNYRGIFENSLVGIVQASLDGQLINANPAMARMLGYDSATVLINKNEKIYRQLYVNPDDRRRILSLLLETGSVQNQEVQFYRIDGEIIWVSIAATLIRDAQGEPLHIESLVIDISDRKAADEDLRRLRNYLSNIINSMPSVLVGVDNQARVTQWNTQAEMVTGLSIEQAQTEPLDKVFPHLRDEIERIYTSIRDRQVLRVSKIPHVIEDDVRYEDITVFPLVGDEIEGAVIRVDDVTERERMEELMIQSEKMLSVGGLAAGMAHEINNPLAGILQNASLLDSRLFQDLPANRSAADEAGITMASLRHYLELRKLPGAIESIRNSGTRATAIVRNMLSFARKSDHTVSNHDLCELMDQTIDLVESDYDMKKKYDFKKIRIIREYNRSNTQVPCEASKIQQVFLNILKNGAEAMADAADERKTPTFTVIINSHETWVQVEIEDTGPGMDEKTRRSVFEPFFTTKPVGKGTGLGLSVSYFIITEDHGGEMWVQNGRHGGARFIIRLPRHRNRRT